ncbi:hypothetical protein [Actinomadura meridiana]|uniref:hypothetical protein n=1 Tax=Actinomadura meridiana TaxID=559626 RepID=UPI0031F077F7
MTTVNRDQLLASAKDYADRALKSYTNEDSKAALTDAAVSLEHLSKAALCNINPALLVDLRKGNLDHLLHLIGEGGRASAGSIAFTVSGAEAIERVKQVVSGIIVPQEQITKLIRLRNGVLHVGTFQQQESHQLLAAYLRLSKRLFAELGVAEADVWGEHQDVVDSVISETLDEVQRDVRRRIAKARRDVEKLRAKIPERQRPFLTARLQSEALTKLPRSTIQGLHSVMTTCPSCGDEGASSLGHVELTAVAEVGTDNFEQLWAMIVEFFVCGVCDLHLQGRDELDAAELLTFIEMPDYEPDFDDYIDDDDSWTID